MLKYIKNVHKYEIYLDELLWIVQKKQQKCIGKPFKSINIGMKI